MKKLIYFLLVAAIIISASGCSFEKETPLKIVTITDPHFTGREFFSYEGTFALANAGNGTGKQVEYINEIFDAFVNRMLSEKPDYIIITGDLAFDGAKVSHLEFAEKLRILSEAGIKVLVLPGNHDITGYAFIFPEGEPETAESVTPEEFKEIYSDFGYSGGISYDENSLSYVYDTEKGVRIFMLDTNIKYGAPLGNLQEGTLEWLENELSSCKEAGDFPLVAGHHSLLSHNPRFDLNFRLGNGEAVSELISSYGGNLYLCGHLHTQHFVRSETLTDIVGGGFCVFPHRYGVIEFTDGGWNYESEITDVSDYAASMGSSDENLLNYSEYGYEFFYNGTYEQVKEAIYSGVDDPELAEKYSVFISELNVAYFGGTFSDVDLSLADEFLETYAGTRWGSYLASVLLDTKDSIRCSWPDETE